MATVTRKVSKPKPITCSLGDCKREPLWRGLCRDHAAAVVNNKPYSDPIVGGRT